VHLQGVEAMVHGAVEYTRRIPPPRPA
jgi:hypothetical protein